VNAVAGGIRIAAHMMGTGRSETHVKSQHARQSRSMRTFASQ
jgi:hypothetical protein